MDQRRLNAASRVVQRVLKIDRKAVGTDLVGHAGAPAPAAHAPHDQLAAAPRLAGVGAGERLPRSPIDAGERAKCRR
jgi:hypothetical protein